MRKKRLKKFFPKTVCLAAAAILIAASLDARASQTSDKLKNTGKKIDELEQKKKDASEKVGNLQEEAGNLKVCAVYRHIHRLGIFGAKLEYVAYLNAVFHSQLTAADGAYVSVSRL